MCHVDRGDDNVPFTVKAGIGVALAILVYIATRIAPHF